MARIRTIKPEFWTDEKIVELSPLARLLFIGLWNFSDDAGNGEGSRRQVKMRIFPGDNIDVDPLIEELKAQGLVSEYAVEGKVYLNIRNFTRHQKINRPSQTRMYPPPKTETLTEASDKKAQEGKGSGREGIKDQGRDQGEKPSWSSPGDDDRRRKVKKRQIDISNPEATRLSEIFAERILSNNPDFRELKPERRDKTLHTWSTEIGRMIRIDGRDPPEIEQVIRWCQADTFWRSNVLSANKLRQQFDRLKMQLKQRGEANGRRSEKDNGAGGGSVQKPGKYAHLGIRINVDAPPAQDPGNAPQGGSAEAIPAGPKG